MGLLDQLFPQSDGGFLDFLKQNASAAINNTPGGLQSDMAQYGGSPAGMAAYQPGQVQSAPLAPPNAMPAPQAQPQMGQPPGPQMPAAQPSPAGMPMQHPLSGIFNRLSDGLQSISRGGSLTGAVRGQFDDPVTQQAATANQTAQFLARHGVPKEDAIAAVQPGNTAVLTGLLKQVAGQGTHAQEVDKDGNVWDVNRQTGQKTIALQAKEDKNSVVQIGEDGLGQKQFGILNRGDGTIKPIAPPNASGSSTGGGLGDMSKTGAEYLATVPQQQRGVLQGMVDGTIQPPSSFAASKPYWQNMLAAAKQLDPNFDANTWASRHKMSTDIASSGNSSIGGILANGKSSFSHLADLSESMAGLGNASHNYPGGGVAAGVQNYLGNRAFAGSDTRAKIKAINDNLGHYGQESTKFYSGTGGGAEERMNALKEMNPETTSSAEMASYVEKEKALMLERLREKERNIRDVMGEAYLQKHPVMTPEFQTTIDKIDSNIAKLRGTQPGAQSAAPTVTEGATATNPQTGQRVMFRGGQWVPVQ